MKRTVLVVMAVAMSAAACSATTGGSAVSAAATAPVSTVAVSASPALVTASPAAVSPSVAPASASPSAVPSPTVAPPTPTATPNLSACPTDQAGNLALAKSLDQALVLADGRLIRFNTAAIGARNDSWWADDAIPAFATLNLGMAPDKTKSDGTYAIAGSPGLTLTGGVARAYRRSQLSGVNGPGVSIKGEPLELKVTVRDGRLTLQMPSTADTWVIELLPQWQTKCLKGDGAAYPLVTTP